MQVCVHVYTRAGTARRSYERPKVPRRPPGPGRAGRAQPLAHPVKRAGRDSLCTATQCNRVRACCRAPPLVAGTRLINDQQRPPARPLAPCPTLHTHPSGSPSFHAGVTG